MQDDGVYELHTRLGCATSSVTDSTCSRRLCDGEDAGHEHQVLAITSDGAPFRVTVRPGQQVLVRTAETEPFIAEFAVVKRRLGVALVMITARKDVLVNGLPALGMTIVHPQDTLTLLPGVPSFVTLRVVPYIGKPPHGLVGQRCPSCKIPLSDDTCIVRHRCGLGYHYETAKSHPHVAEEERLRCFEKLRVCMSCNHPMTLEESLVWDPSSV